MKNCLWLLLFCFIVQHKTVAQTDTLASRNQSDFITRIDDYFNLSLDLETDFEEFEVEGSNFNYQIRPNYSFVNKLGIDYRAISIFYTFTPNFASNQDDDLKGSTESGGLGFSWNTDHLINHVETSHVKGFYLTNTAEFDNNFIEGISPYIQFPDLDVHSFRGFHAFKWNKNFSYSAFTAQMALQTKSAGSLAAGFSYNFFKIENNTPTGQRSKNFEFLFHLPYYHTFVFNRNWFINLGLVPGVGMVNTKLKTPVNGQDVITKNTNLIGRINGTFGLGYNSPGLFGGIEGSINTSLQRQGKSDVKQELHGFAFRVFIGWHILAPKKINTLYDKFEDKFL